MNRRFTALASIVFSVASLLGTASFAQVDDPASPDAHAASPAANSTLHSSAYSEGNRLGGHVGIAVKLSLLGPGFEVATPISHKMNVRAGFNAFSYSRDFDKDGVSYGGQLSFRSMEAHLDFFPWAGAFHLSPGMLVYNGNQITANASVPGTQSFSLGGTSYYSDPLDPITGKGKISFNSVAPMVTLGWGNLLSRSSKRFSVPVEFGVAFEGSPKVALNLSGSACDSTGFNCRSVSDPTIQSNIQSEQTKITNSISALKVYPIISVGFGYKF